MKFSTREDLEVPIDRVFEALSEFETFERLAIRRGVDVRRTDTLRSPGVGARWHARFVMRGKTRDLELELTEYDQPTRMRFDSVSPSLSGRLDLELVALSTKRTRMIIGIDMRPKTLAARLLVQSLKFAKTNLDKRFKLRVADYVKDMERRLRDV
ncbi:MAG: SRPBCC family protein [Pseudomonadota bacterium]